MEKHSISFGNKKIEFNLIRKRRKNLRISVLPDLSINIIAPEERTIEEIMEKVRKRAMWILKQQRYFQQFHPFQPSKEYVSGETHKYLGRQYRLKVIEAEKNQVKLKGKYIYIFSNKKYNTQQIEELLYDWYRNHAKIKFESIIDKYITRLSKYEINKPKVSIRRMKSRWGSCKASNQHINLNLELIMTPIQCIEYVIMHELCHLKFSKHTKEFYQFLSIMMPDWKQRKNRLEKGGVGICSSYQYKVKDLQQ